MTIIISLFVAQAALAQAPAASPVGLQRSDESIYVVQERAFTKKGRLEITPAFFSSLNNKFVGHLGGAVSLAYHFRENLALEVNSVIPGLMFARYSDLVYELRDRRLTLQPAAVDLKRLTYFGAVSMQFSALYGKARVASALIDYDLYLSVGLGIATTEEACLDTVDDAGGQCGEQDPDLLFGLREPLETVDRRKYTGNLALGFRAFFSDRLGVRAELRDVLFADRAPDLEPTSAPVRPVSTDIRSNMLLYVGMSVLI